MNNKNINELPEKCLVAIFVYLPVKDLLKIAVVCRLWKEAQAKVCQQRRSLSVRGHSILNSNTEEEAISQFVTSDFLAFFNVKHYDLFEPYYQSIWLDEEDRVKTSAFLVKKFPNVQRFSFYGNNIAIKDLMNLLNKWSHLTHLTLIIPTNFNWNIAWKYINSLRSLEYLSLIVAGGSIPNLPRVISRLKEFHYASLEGIGKQLCDLISQLNRSEIKRIGIGNFQQQYFDINRNQAVLKKLTKSNPWVSGKVVRFSSHLTPMSISLLNWMCNSFLSLQFLNISFEEKVTFAQLLTKLSKLTNLTDLRLGSLQKNSMIEMVRNQENDPFECVTVDNIRNTAQLKSVKVLHIYDFECDNSKMHLLEYFFPQMESITIQDQANFCWHPYPYPKMSCQTCPQTVFQALVRIKTVRSVKVISKGDIIFEK